MPATAGRCCIAAVPTTIVPATLMVGLTAPTMCVTFTRYTGAFKFVCDKSHDTQLQAP